MNNDGVYGLLGSGLGYSYSPQAHKMLGGYDYGLLEMDRAEAVSFVRSGDWDGLNICRSYQESILPLCDALTDAVRKVGSVNAIVRREDGSICGHNTDYYGFSHLLNVAGLDVAFRKVVVLGGNATAKAVRRVLLDRGAREVVMAGDGCDISLDGLSNHYDAEYVVNASYAGMYPDCPDVPIELHPFAETGELRRGYADGLFAYVDTVYNPARSGLALQAEKLGIPVFGGLPMFVAQAAASVELFSGVRVTPGRMDEVERRLAIQCANIVLIGMPSGGKSTIGSLVAKKLGRPFADIDDLIPAVAGKSIPEIFSEDGEERFRSIETGVTADVCRESGSVIACGGGVVTRPENYDLLHQNGIIVLLRRPLDRLISDGRPLSISKGVPAIARERAPLYMRWADVVVDNEGKPDFVADRVIESVLAHLDSDARGNQ